MSNYTDSSDSSEENEQIKRILESADNNLLNNDMFQKDQPDGPSDFQKIDVKYQPKSQRFFLDNEQSAVIDYIIPESTQKYIYNKLSTILDNKYEFCEISNQTKNSPKVKSRIKLLKDYGHYVKSYEEFEYENKGPGKRPIIKRRSIDKVVNLDKHVLLENLAVDGNDVLSGKGMENWEIKKERRDKVFHYKTRTNGILYAREKFNEFTEKRLENKWSENKIKMFKR